jgi:NAD(P)-dependent dehydrogenase (short-subunit alcohol dehydrogenase family)
MSNVLITGCSSGFGLLTAERFARDFFALAARLHVGGVEDVEVCVPGAIDDGVAVFGAGTPPEQHAAEAERRDLHARAAEGSKLRT